MRLAAGARLGPYEILVPLGAGGMGEVYRARDTRLGRDVAIRILSPDTASSPEARQRFEREARTISQLSHPHICALYDVGESASHQLPAPSPYLVMELLDGETLAQRLASGALPLEQTIRDASQIADALEKAHRSGIVHRDLKPANVMITRSGVKLLDFGLAKPVAPAALSAAHTLPQSPPLTAHGAIAGTIQYMAPEQLAGRDADARSDIYALGAMIYEMATGTRVFASTPKPLVPDALDRLVRGCLAADPDERWQSAHDVRLQLAAIGDGQIGDARAAPPSPVRRIPWLIAALATAAAAAAWLQPTRKSAAAPQATVKLALPPPRDGAFLLNFETVNVAVSRDGSQIAFVGYGSSGPRRIWIRPLADLEAHPLAGTEGASSMFWSPDGRSLAFFAGGKLRRIDIRGGAPVSIADVPAGIGLAGTWGADGQILFTSIEGEAIWSVPAGGGVPSALLRPDASRDGKRLNWPTFLPDGRRFLYLMRSADGAGHLMIAGPGTAPREVRPMQSNVAYVEPGYLVFAAEGSLLAQRFDARAGSVSGDPFSVADEVFYFSTTSVAGFATSSAGTLVYNAHDDEQRLTWFDRSGRSQGTFGEPGRYQSPRISPDGRKVAFDRTKAGSFDIWAFDIERGSETRLTFGKSSEGGTVWSPDSRSIYFRADLGGPPRIFRKDLASGVETLALPGSGTMQESEDVSPDGRTLLFTQRASTGFDVWQWPTDGSHAATVIAKTSFDSQSVRFSPNGRAYSYHSNVSGAYEVYVSPFPPVGPPSRVSPAGGSFARWSRNGRELFYLGADGRLMAAPVASGASDHVGVPVALFPTGRSWSDFDVDASGRFLAIVTERRSAQQPQTVVLNWTAALDR